MKNQIYSLADSELESTGLIGCGKERQFREQIHILKLENAECKRKEQALRALNTVLGHSFGSITNDRADNGTVAEIRRMLAEAMTHPTDTLDQLKEYYQNIITSLRRQHQVEIQKLCDGHQSQLEEYRGRVERGKGGRDRENLREASNWGAHFGNDVEEQEEEDEYENEEEEQKMGRHSFGKVKFLSDLSVNMPKPILKDNHIRKHSRAESISSIVSPARVNVSAIEPYTGFRSHRNKSVATQLLCNNCNVPFPPIDFFSHIQICKAESIKPKKVLKKTKRDKETQDSGHISKLIKQKRQIEERIDELKNTNRQVKQKAREGTELKEVVYLVRNKRAEREFKEQKKGQKGQKEQKQQKIVDSGPTRKEKYSSYSKVQPAEAATANFGSANLKKRASFCRIR